MPHSFPCRLLCALTGIAMLGACAAPLSAIGRLDETNPAVLQAAQANAIEASRTLATASTELREALDRRAPPAAEASAVPDNHAMVNRRIAISMQNARIGQLLWILSSEYGISLAVEPAVLEMPQTVSLQLQQVTGRQALDHILRVFDVYGQLGPDNVLVVSMSEERVFDLGMLAGRSNLELSSGGDVFGSGSKDGGSGLKNSLTIKSDMGDKGDNFDYIAKSIEAILGENASGPAGQAGAREKPRMSINRGSGTLYIRAAPSVVRTLAKLVASESKFREQQIQIDAQIIDVQLNDQSQFGIDWSLFGSRFMGRFGAEALSIGPGATTTAASVIPGTRSVTIPAQALGAVTGTGGGIGFRSNHFSLAVNALKSFGAVRIHSNPSVLVRNGTPAYLSVGNSIRYVQKITSSVNNLGGGSSTTSLDVVTDSVFSGVVVGVSAIVKKNGMVELFIHPSQTQVSDASLALIEVGAGNKVTLPVVSTKGIATTLNIQNGDTVVIGGLIDQNNSGVSGGVPGLSDLPGIGKAFTTDNTVQNARELVVVLRARVL
jgi:general secretion pathway protein D